MSMLVMKYSPNLTSSATVARVGTAQGRVPVALSIFSVEGLL
jgi:hypothetical protein